MISQDHYQVGYELAKIQTFCGSKGLTFTFSPPGPYKDGSCKVEDDLGPVFSMSYTGFRDRPNEQSLRDFYDHLVTSWAKHQGSDK
jgi:hypothetical protein